LGRFGFTAGVSALAKLGLAAAAVAVAVVLFVLLRPDDEAATSTQATPSATETGDGTKSTTSAEPRGPAPVQITVQSGEVSGPRRPQFTAGDRVILIVRSDVADEVHVHGYDLMKDVARGEPARISFTADAPGRFEVELESRHLPLTELVVEP
jgi:hypothetical protein